MKIPLLSSLSSSSSLLIDNTNRRFLLLDGGTGEELFARGVPDDRKIWSATAVVNEKYHSILQDVHNSFIQSGSDFITTNSYGIIPGVGFTKDEIQKYVTLAGKLAWDTTHSHQIKDKRTAKVLGSVGPLVESYRADLIMDHASGVEYYSIIVEALAPNVDYFLLETMSCVEEVKQVIDAISQLSEEQRHHIFVSFTMKKDGFVRGGTHIIEVIKETLGYAKNQNVIVEAILMNCSEPEVITAALEFIYEDDALQTVLSENKVMIGAYANKLTPVPEGWTLADSTEPQAMREDLPPQEYFKFVQKWVNDLNVQIVGGCCGITPEHISYMKQHL